VKIALLFIFIAAFGGWVDRMIMIGRFRRDTKRDKTNRLG
jgi:hypothetical protein